MIKSIIFTILVSFSLAQNTMLRDMAPNSKMVTMANMANNMDPIDMMPNVQPSKGDPNIEMAPSMKTKMAGMAAMQTSQSMDDMAANMASAAYSDARIKVDTYNLATTFFNSQRYFGDVCNRCKKLEYFAFRMGKTYLTAYPGDLQWTSSSSPANNQLFIGEQQIDGTWAFKSLTEGKYIRADSDGSTINWQTYVGPWERWYMERHGSHVHVQSAQFQFFYWVNNGSFLGQFRGGASSLIVEHWPAINWLWNW